MYSAAIDLSRQLGPLRRSLLRATKDTANLPDIPDAHIEVLRVLAEEPSMSPGDLAERLNLARSTVSNLVKAMVTSGLVHRSVSGADLRGATLTASPKATNLLAKYDSVSSQVLSSALEELSSEDRRALADAVPAITAITAILSRSAR